MNKSKHLQPPAPVVVVTGCSSGFGRLIAIEAARRGHTVVATVRNPPHATDLTEAAKAAGVTLDVRKLDLDDGPGLAAAIHDIEQAHGRIDALVNNAGFGFGGTLYDLTLDELRQQFETNFFGTVAVTKAVLVGMVARKSGRIVNVSSASSINPTPGVGAYAASKAALDALSQSLRMELHPFGIHVTNVLPGQFRTDGFAKKKVAAAAQDASSPFFAMTGRVLARTDALVAKNARDPAIVTGVVVDLLEAKRPPWRVIVGPDAKLQALLRRVLPRAWVEKVLRRVLGVDG